VAAQPKQNQDEIFDQVVKGLQAVIAEKDGEIAALKAGCL
jgi:hypothetical protein